MELFMELHPLCTLFPRITGFELECLKLDIKENGLRTPITTYNGMVLDGGNRLQACLSLGINPVFEEYVGDNLSAFVLTSNLHRRHLTPGQQAAIVACVQDWAKAHSHGGDRKSAKCNVAPCSTSKDRAAQSGASERTQKTADKIAKAAPDMAAAVGRGEITLPQAEKKLFPKQAQDPEQSEPEYTELDAAHDQIEDLQNIVSAGFMATTDEDRATSLKLLADLRNEIKTLRATLSATESQRDSYMRENEELKKQCAMQQKKIKKLETK